MNEIYVSTDVEADGPIPRATLHAELWFSRLPTGLGLPFRDCTKRNMPKKRFDDLPHTHKALEDAIEHGALSCNMLHDNARKA